MGSLEGNKIIMGWLQPITKRNRTYPSYFKLKVRWLRSLTRITYFSKFIGIRSLVAFLQLELFRVDTSERSK